MSRASVRSALGWRVVGIAVALLTVVACAEPLKVGRPLYLDPGSPYPEVRELRAALVRPAGIRANWNADLPGLDARVAAALTEGLATATRCLIRSVDLVDAVPAEGYDLAVIPDNIVFEAGRTVRVVISMEVTVRRLRDGKEFGLLVEGEEGPGEKRLYAEWQRETQTLLTVGTPLSNPPLGRAIHNAMFVTCMDYARKLERRLASIVD